MGSEALRAFVSLVGQGAWNKRMAALKRNCTPTHAGRSHWQRHAIEFSIEKRRARQPGMTVSAAEQNIACLAAACVRLATDLPAEGGARLRAALHAALQDGNTLVPVFHVLRTAAQHRRKGFAVHFSGFADGAAYDLQIERDGVAAEIACAVISAETGRDVHRHAWSMLLDRVDPDLQAWLASHPGRYLLKMTLPQGLRHAGCAESTERLASLHRRITRMLSDQRRADYDEAAVLRLDPLTLAAAQANDTGLMPRLRSEFGPQAHLAVTGGRGAVFVMAARASREDEVAQAVHRSMAEIAPARFSGERPGILAMFLEDTDRLQWQNLRDQLRLEGEARQFMTKPEARAVVAITCSSRCELFGGADEAADLRFRNPSHPFSRQPALSSAILSSCGACA